ncbi:Outer membrane lipoprotein Blc [Cronobacter muytjensii 530]|nr:lipocalin family protein [Cronobacter muytjensii]
MRIRLLPVVATVATAALLVACSTPTPPRGVTVVEDFNVNRYLGTWYEIARFDHRFERGLEQVTATYSLRGDGGLNVINRGFNPDRNKWQQSEGKAYFTGNTHRAALKVSFFGPFYGGYNIIALDKDYQHALICGPDRSYLWILSRTPTISKQVKEDLLDTATRQGFAVEKLIWVDQRAR